MRQLRWTSVTENMGARWWMGHGRKTKRIRTEWSAKAKSRNQEIYTVCPKREEQWLKTLSEWEFPSATLKYTSKRNCTPLVIQLERNCNKKIVESRSNVNFLSYVQKSLEKHALYLYKRPTLLSSPLSNNYASTPCWTIVQFYQNRKYCCTLSETHSNTEIIFILLWDLMYFNNT